MYCSLDEAFQDNSKTERERDKLLRPWEEPRQSYAKQNHHHHNQDPIGQTPQAYNLATSTDSGPLASAMTSSCWGADPKPLTSDLPTRPEPPVGKPLALVQECVYPPGHGPQYTSHIHSNHVDHPGQSECMRALHHCMTCVTCQRILWLHHQDLQSSKQGNDTHNDNDNEQPSRHVKRKRPKDKQRRRGANIMRSRDGETSIFGSTITAADILRGILIGVFVFFALEGAGRFFERRGR